MNPQRHGLEIKDAILKLLNLVEEENWDEAQFFADGISREIETCKKYSDVSTS